MKTLPHASFENKSIEETFKLFETSSEGLSSIEVEKRLKEFGKNLIKEEKINKLRILLRQFKSILIYILFAASMISISIGEFTDFLVINFIIFFNSLLAFWQEIRAETSIIALKKLTESKNHVVREGKTLNINSSELAMGDYIIFHEGDAITCDVRLVESSGLMVNESSITGESVPVIKDHSVIQDENTQTFELKNMLLAGTSVVRGTGKGIAIRTGCHTYLAKIAKQSQEISPETPLTKALNFFSTRYVAIMIALFTLLGLVGFMQERSLLDLSYILLSSLVSVVPEGLPIVITLVMVIGTITLSKRQALIRYLPAVETLGSTTVIASDKTGTITGGNLIVKEIYSNDVEKLKLIAALCNDSHDGAGDPLDVALSVWVGSVNEIRRNHPRKWTYSFDSKLRLMATVNALGHCDQLLVKGAFETLKEKVENENEIKEFEQKCLSFLDQGLRVLAFGTGEWKNQDPSEWKIKIIGLIGFLDPAKEGVKEAVLSAKQAGIRLLMITGDHAKTALAVAKDVEIWKPENRVLSGKEIDSLSDEQLLEATSKTTVFARILPEHKCRIVQLLQKNGEIVAVTGDGVNDVPALKAANIGIAMGSGTEAAKNASKMVITDNNLKVIISSVENARVIAENIRKVIYYLVSISIQEIILIALSIFTSLPLPLSAIQILWINMVTAGVQDKTFAFAKAEGDVMKRKPKKPEKQFFDLQQVIRISIFGITMGLFTFFLYLFLIDRYPFITVTTIIFTTIAMIEWANGIQAQKDSEPYFKNILKSISINPYIFIGTGLGISLQCVAVYVIPSLFQSSPLTHQEWKYPLLGFAASFLIIETRKWVEFILKVYFKYK